jgi:hypothetical protein
VEYEAIAGRYAASSIMNGKRGKELGSNTN